MEPIELFEEIRPGGMGNSLPESRFHSFLADDLAACQLLARKVLERHYKSADGAPEQEPLFQNREGEAPAESTFYGSGAAGQGLAQRSSNFEFILRWLS